MHWSYYSLALSHWYIINSQSMMVNRNSLQNCNLQYHDFAKKNWLWSEPNSYCCDSRMEWWGCINLVVDHTVVGVTKPNTPIPLFSSFFSIIRVSGWRHQMETFSALLANCAGNSPVPSEFPAHRPVTWSFDVFFDLRLNKRLSKQLWGWWFEMLSRPLWCHRNDWLPIDYHVHV